jgi:Lon-like ATP-dependent protease
MLRAAAAAAAILPVRFAAAPTVAAAEELRSPLLRVIGTLRGGRGSVLLGRRVRFCSNSSASDSEAAAAEAKAEDATAAEGEADSKASSAIVSTNTNLDDCLSVCSSGSESLALLLVSAVRFFPLFKRLSHALGNVLEMCYE